MALSNINIVLVEPTHPGNIGSVARAMKTMGLSSLVMVNPKKFPHYEATKLAAGADSVLDQALVVGTVKEAIADATLVLGTSVRDRDVTWPTQNPRQLATTVFSHIEKTSNAKIAILFGRESSGLTNEELDFCRFQIRIDANPEYSSLNLASAVQIMAYELRMQFLNDDSLSNSNGIVKNVDSSSQQQAEQNASIDLNAAQARQQDATHAQLEGHIQHLQSTLEALDFIKVKPPTVLMRKIKRLYNKANLSVEEIQILRGILSATQDQLKKGQDQ